MALILCRAGIGFMPTLSSFREIWVVSLNCRDGQIGNDGHNI